MGIMNSSVNNIQQLQVATERLKLLKVVGEAIGQVVLERTIPINAIKIIRIEAELRDVTDHLFQNKVVKQGKVHLMILYVDPAGVVHFTTDNVPFMLVVDIPGFTPGAFSEVQNHLLDIAVDFNLIPVEVCHLGRLMMKIVVHILVIASEWTQLDVVTKVDIFPKVFSSSKTCCCLTTR